MSRIASSPITLPAGVDFKLKDQLVTVKGTKGSLEHQVHPSVQVDAESDVIKISMREASKQATALAGTTRALIQNMVTGVSTGFERTLEINGVGYRAQVQGKVLDLTLGFSHPINYPIPEGIEIQTPSQTKIVVQGIDKQKVGQVAAEIRAYRKPEPYKGKGIKYSDEVIVRKEAKKS